MEALDPALDWDGHLLLVHRTEQERRSGVSAWVADCLRRDAKVVYFEEHDAAPERALAGILGSHPVPRASEALASGQIQVLEPDRDVLSADGQRHLLERALADGYSSLRLSGEVDRARTAVTQDVHDEAESTVDRLCRSQPVSALCQYPAGLDADRMDGVFDVHTGGLLACGVHVRVDGDRIRLYGEVDLAAAEPLQLWLRSAFRDVHGGLGVLDLTGLGFLDVAGYRSILWGSADLRSAGGRVLVRGAHGAVERLLAVLGANGDAGVEVER